MSLLRPRHWKSYHGRGVSLICGDRLVYHNFWRGANFHTSCCQGCGMEVTTYGHSPDTDKVMETKKWQL